MKKPQGSLELLLPTTCLRIVDLGLLGVIFVVPFFFGARHDLGRGIFIALVATIAVAWSIRQASIKQAIWYRTWAYAVAVISIAVVAFQLIPLPLEWWEQIAPRNSSLLSLWNNDSSLSMGTWQTISMTPEQTKIALATLVAYVLLFITAVGRLQSQKDIQHMLKMIALGTVFMSVFGLLQYFTSNGLFFWFYEYPDSTTSRAVKGGFVCRNHFAHYAVLGFGPLLAWTLQLLQQRQTTSNSNNKTRNILFLYLSLIVVAFAILLSLSRGGAIALMLASTVAVIIFQRRNLISEVHLYGLATLALMVIALLSFYGSDVITERLNSIASGEVEKIDEGEGRRKIWKANLASIQHGGLLGAGAGSHREIYQVYLPDATPGEYTHAENGYLQIPTENGIVGAMLLAVTILMVLNWCWNAVRYSQSNLNYLLSGAVTASLAATLMHSIVDFVWFIPACMSIVILLAASALRLAQINTESDSSISHEATFSHLYWKALAATVVLAALWTVSAIARPAWAATQWDSYLIVSYDVRDQAERSLATNQIAPQDDHLLAQNESAIYYLQQLLARYPDSPRANLKLAGRYLRLFDLRQKELDNAMSIDQIRDAAMSSEFASAEELQQWLQRAFGDNSKLLYRAYHHTKLALQLCPLQGEGYLYLANLCFLQGHNHQAIEAYLNQCLEVRPHDGQVLFEVGRQKLLLGQGDEAIDHWKKIFKDYGSHQLRIVQLLAGRIPAANFIESFKPSWYTLPLLWQRYRNLGNEEDWPHILRSGLIAAKEASEKIHPDLQARNWCKLADMHSELEDYDQAIICLNRAWKISPTHYTTRKSLGKTLLQTQQYSLATEHLHWCNLRRPHDAAVKRYLIEARKQTVVHSAKKNTLFKVN